MVSIKNGFNSFFGRFGKPKENKETKAKSGSDENDDVDLQTLHRGVIQELQAKNTERPSKAPVVKRESIQAARGEQAASGGWLRGAIRGASTQSLESKKPIKKISPKIKASKLIETKKNNIPARTFANDVGQVRHLRKDLRPWVSNMHEAGRRSLDEMGKQFTEAIEKRNDLDPEQKRVLKKKVADFVTGRKIGSARSENRDLNKEEFKTGSDEALVNDKQQVGQLKQISKDIEKGVHESLRDASRDLVTVVSGGSEISEELKTVFSTLGEGLADSVSDIEGQKRFEVIHEDSFWDPSKPHVSPMLFEGSDDTHVLAVSSFQAAGPGRSSQAPRNNPKNPKMANFFKTGMTVKAKGRPERARELFSATRSAITVEFDVVDGQQRAEANKKLVKQQLDSQVGTMFAEMSDEEIDAAVKKGKPLILKSQTTNLLTPDLGRNLARENQSVADMASKLFNQHAGAPADDERALALENLVAHQHWDKQEAQEYTVTKADGTQVTVKVEYDIAYFNIPNNKMAETYQKKGLSTFLRPKEIEEANKKSWGKLEKDVEERKTELDGLLKDTFASSKLNSSEKLIVRDLLQKSAAKQEQERSKTRAPRKNHG